jgi:hypothetical protein
MRYFATVIAFAVVASLARAEDKPDYGDTTLRHYLSRSHRVIVAEVTSEKVRGVATSSGQVIYKFDVVVKDAIKGEDTKDSKLTVSAIRWDMDQSKEALPVLKKDTVLILFLSKGDRTVDQWFGIQPFNSWMVMRLKGIIAKKSKEVPTKPSTATE